MRRAFFLNSMILLTSLTCLSQIKGNKNIITRTFEISNLEFVKVNLYANLTIDSGQEENMTITADSNLFDLIFTKVEDGILDLNQKEWISPSESIIISIGAPQLKRLESNTHGTTKIVNVNNKELRVNAPVGTVIIEGKTESLRLGSEISNIDASKIVSTKAFVNLWDSGKVTVNVKDYLWGEISNDGTLVYLSKPDELHVNVKRGARAISLEESKKAKNKEAVFIKFKIKNNSWNRNNFEVIGPKPDGTKFGYGFPMMPYAIRHENWSVGTKVYRINSLGFRKLLRTISLDDEGTIVSLFN